MALETFNFTDGSISGQMRPHDVTLIENDIVIERNILDFSLQTLVAADEDVGIAITIPANTTVLTARVRVLTAETANGSIDIGYGGNVDQWGDGLSLATADVILGGLDAPVFFAAADTIDVKVTADGAAVDIDGAKIEVLAYLQKHIDNN